MCGLLLAMSAQAQYKGFDNPYFEVGDSLRLDLEFAFGTFYPNLDMPFEQTQEGRFLQFLKSQPRVKVAINAHTNVKGSFDKNHKLSEQRAKAFRTWLEEQGIRSDRLKDIGWGESHPIVSEDTIDYYRRIDQAKFDSLHALNRRITIIITDAYQEANCAYRGTTYADYEQYYKKEKTKLRVGDRYRLDFVEFMDDTNTLILDESSEVEFDELAAFIHCHPGVTFEISAHESKLMNDDPTDTRLTQMRADVLAAHLARNYDIPREHLIPVGYGSLSNIIPEVIINQYDDDIDQQKKLHAVNERFEISIANFGVYNNQAFGEDIHLDDSQATRDLIYRTHPHVINVHTKESFQTMRALSSEPKVSMTRVDDHNWTLKVQADDRGKKLLNLSFVAMNGDERTFLGTKTWEVKELSAPDLYIGPVKISDESLQENSDKRLFNQDVIAVRYDTSIVHLNQSFGIEKYIIEVGPRVFTLSGSKFPKKLKKYIERAKKGTKIKFRYVYIHHDPAPELFVERTYVKKTKMRTPLFTYQKKRKKSKE